MKQFLLLCLLTLGSLLRAEAPINKTWRGIALDGYDAVAYFEDAKAVEGNSDFTTEWKGATWRFASADHRDKFAKEPERYAPQFGGYCAWAVGHGYTANIDPEAWRIIEGKLYLNYNKKVQKQWEEDIPGWIAKGEVNWPKLIDKE